MNTVKYDFTTTVAIDQEVAIMPANLAKILLTGYANNLARVPKSRIMRDHIDNLSQHLVGDNLPDFIAESLAFVNERQLIDNILVGKWHAYTVANAEAEQEEQLNEIEA